MAYLIEQGIFRGRERKSVSPSLYSQFDLEIFVQHCRLSSPFKPAISSIDALKYLRVKTELADQSCLLLERLFSPFSIKTLSPFLSYDMLFLASKIPHSIERKNPFEEILQKINPQAPLKHQNPGPPQSWLQDPALRKAFALLSKGLAVEEGLISAKWIRRQLAYPYLTPSNFQQLWSLLILEIWFRLFVNGPIHYSHADMPLEELLTN